MVPLAFLLALAVGFQAADAVDFPGGVKKAHSPDTHARLAVSFLRVLQPEDRYHTRFLSFYHLDSKSIPVRAQVLQWWINQMSFDPAVAKIVEVPKSAGRLWAVDLRDVRWNAASFAAVARREPYFREPWIASDIAILLRQEIGVGQDPKTLHAEAVVRADWFFRDTIEGDRSQSYYDLLFTRQRFGDVVQHKGGLLNGKELAPGQYTIGGGDPNFPKDEADFDKAFGLDKVAQVFKESDIDLRGGAVVAGFTDDPVRGSMVARHNRLLEFKDGPFGPAFSSYDAEETSKDTDYLEKSGDAVIKGKNIKFAAKEILYGLPNGGQAALLVDKDAKRIEIADPKVARDLDPLDVRVRNPGSCAVCHGASNGFIMPKDLVKDIMDKGVDVPFKRREDRNAYLAFFIGWDDRVEGWQKRYKGLVERGTALPGVKSLTSQSLVKTFAEWRREYDGPVTLEMASAELACPKDLLVAILSKSPRARLSGLVQGIAVPRSAWEAEEFRQAALLITSEGAVP